MACGACGKSPPGGVQPRPPRTGRRPARRFRQPRAGLRPSLPASGSARRWTAISVMRANCATGACCSGPKRPWRKATPSKMSRSGSPRRCVTRPSSRPEGSTTGIPRRISRQETSVSSSRLPRPPPRTNALPPRVAPECRLPPGPAQGRAPPVSPGPAVWPRPTAVCRASWGPPTRSGPSAFAHSAHPSWSAGSLRGPSATLRLRFPGTGPRNAGPRPCPACSGWTPGSVSSAAVADCSSLNPLPAAGLQPPVA